MCVSLSFLPVLVLSVVIGCSDDDSQPMKWHRDLYTNKKESLYSLRHKAFIIAHHPLSPAFSLYGVNMEAASGASLQLLIWVSFTLFFPVFASVTHVVDGKKEIHLDDGSLRQQQPLTKRLRGLGKLGQLSFESSVLPLCVKLDDSVSLTLEAEGDIVIGGFFPIHNLAPRPQHSYSSKPQITPCYG